jgi:hypothetical protein
VIWAKYHQNVLSSLRVSTGMFYLIKPWATNLSFVRWQPHYQISQLAQKNVPSTAVSSKYSLFPEIQIDKNLTMSLKRYLTNLKNILIHKDFKIPLKRRSL